MSPDMDTVDLGQALGAQEAFPVQRFSIYLPDRDKEGNAVPNIEAYIEAGMRLLADINMGVTRMPAAEGMWRDEQAESPEKGEEPVRENTVVLFSYLRDPDRFLQQIDEVREFLHAFGNDTGQGEVMVEFFGESLDGGVVARSYFIRDFAPAG